MTSPLKKFLRARPDTQYLDAIVCDLSCVMRGKRYPIALADKIFSGGMMLPGSSFLLAVSGESLDPEGMGFSDGDPDEVAVPIDNTLVPSPWAKHPTAQVMLTMQSLAGEAYYFEPRNVLARVLEKFAKLKLKPIIAFELEFYLLDRQRDLHGNPQPPRDSGGQRSNATQVYSIDSVEDFSPYLHEVAQACETQGIACGAVSAEYAPGQFEINLPHGDDPLGLADQCVMFRRAVRCVAHKHNLQGTFMAKPQPQDAGSGLHLHISMLDENGHNIFDGGDDRNAQCASPQLLNAIGGLVETMPEAMAILAPNVNSYKRFMPNNYVPVRANWGYENRSVAIRIPKSAGAARRIEHRVAGADANPYLTLAALLAGIHHGIANQITAPKPACGNAGKTRDRNLPFTPPDAFDKCRNGKILSAYFGKRYVDAYTSCKAAEYRAFVDSGEAEVDWYL